MNLNESPRAITSIVPARPYADWYECWDAPSTPSVRTARPLTTKLVASRRLGTPASAGRSLRMAL